MSIRSTAPHLFTFRTIFLFAAWAVALFGSLQVHRWEDLLGHAICGPWGCGPPLSALIGYHGYWFLLLLLPAWLLKHQLAADTSRRIGAGLFLVATIGIALLLAVDGWQAWQRESLRPYLVQRMLFRLATFVDFPLVQLGLIGLWLRNPATSHPNTSSEDPADDDRLS